MLELDFTQCEVVPCIFLGKNGEVVEIHQDDFYVTAPGEHLRKFIADVSKQLDVDASGLLGEGTTWEHLKRVRTRTADNIYITPSAKYI